MMRVLSPGPAELLAASRAVEDSGRQVVAPFHGHRRRLSTAGIRRYHEAGGALALADWLRCWQVPAALEPLLERAYGPIARLRLVPSHPVVPWLS